MFDYISALYYGDPIHTHRPSPFEDETSAISCQLACIRAEMGEPFANKLASRLRIAFNSERSAAFRDGFRLGGQLMLSIVDSDD